MKSIVLIVRGCPVGCLGAYGNEWIATPNIDTLAAEGTVYDRHDSDCPDPLAARRAWWGADGPDDAPKYLIRAHRAEHDAPSEYYAGWAEVFDARPGANPADALDALLPGVLSKLSELDDWRLVIELDRLLPPWHVPRELFAVYVEDLLDVDEGARRKRDPGYDDEEEYEPPPEADPIEPWADPPVGWFDRADFPSWELLHRSFATVVTGLDAELGWLFERFREHGLDVSADWLVTSDFGYPLGEHGIVGPFRPWLYEEFVHLPLIVRRAGGADAGRRVEAITQPMDLRAILRNEVLPMREAAITRLELNGGSEIARRTATEAILLPLRVPEDDDPREPQFYLKPDDRWEANDVRSEFLDRAEAIEAELRSSRGGEFSNLPVDS